jgi:hypothetical protein
MVPQKITKKLPLPKNPGNPLKVMQKNIEEIMNHEPKIFTNY